MKLTPLKEKLASKRFSFSVTVKHLIGVFFLFTDISRLILVVILQKTIKPMDQYTYGLEDLEVISKKIIENAKSKILCFDGNMGVGKTTLIKAVVKQLGSSDRVSSPTFSLVNEYDAHGTPVYHFDFYRIEHSDEAYQIGLENYLYSGSWCLIEWPDKIAELLPENVTLIEIKEQLSGKRTLVLQ